MFLIDSHEPIEIDLLISQSCPVQRVALNPVKPDYVLAGQRIVGVERKQGGELLSSLDSVEEQLGRELRGPIDNLCLLVEGIITPDPATNGCVTWKQAKSGKVMFQSRTFNQNYKGYRAWVHRLWEEGVPVMEVPSLHASATTLVALYQSIQKPDSDHKTFMRLVKEKYYIKEEDVGKKNLALTLMGVSGARWGEELGLAVADNYTTFDEFYCDLKATPDAVEVLQLRSGKRTIGKAAVANMRKALGIP